MASYSPECCIPKAQKSFEIGIYDEAEPLKTVSTWGPVGAEAVLAQCYPENISLFYDSFNVIAARQEGLGFANILEDHGINVLMVRDLLAQALKPKTLSKESVILSMIEKGKMIQDTYHTTVPGFESLIETLVEKDIERYGEKKALVLNKTLSVNPQLPLGNSIYGRDQMNVLLNTRVVSRMAKDIRRREVSLYEYIYQQHLMPHRTITIPKGETFEGGDAYIHNGSVFVGVGTRTTMGAAISIYQALKPLLHKHDLKFAVVEDSNPFGRSFNEQQDSMHLDTFSNPIGKREIAVCIEEASRRTIKFLQSSNGHTTMSDGTQRFIDYLERTEDYIVTVPEEEQKGFGCNFLLKGEDANGHCIIFVPLRSNTEINNQLEKRGKEVIHTDLFESTKGYGAAHCMTGQLQRSET